jgi:hypothetical protein
MQPADNKHSESCSMRQHIFEKEGEIMMSESEEKLRIDLLSEKIKTSSKNLLNQYESYKRQDLRKFE